MLLHQLLYLHQALSSTLHNARHSHMIFLS